MRGFRSSASLISWLILLCAGMCLVPGGALAQPVVVNGFITAQPISVCATDGSGCAPTNNINQTGSNALIGFKEPVSGDNTTDFLATRLLGLRITWLPLVTFASPIIQSTGTTLQTLHFAPVNGDCTNLTSSDFPLLVQNFILKQGSNPPTYTVPNPTNPPGVPINSNAGVPNVFFVNNLAVTGCSGTSLSGFARIGGNGVVINKKIFSLPLLPDVIFHEMTHNFGLPHVSAASNLMAAGGSRMEPTITPSPGTLASQAGVSLDILLGGLSPPAPNSQTAQVLDPVGFINPILEVQTTITCSTPTMNPCTSNTFLVTVTIPAPLPDVSVTSVFWEVPPPLGFQPNTFKCNPINCNGLKLTAGNFQGDIGNNDGSLFCGPGSVKCFRIDIDPTTPFAGGSFSFYLQMSNSNKKTQLTDLTGSNFTYVTSTQYATTSGVAFTNTNPATLFADSLEPNLAISSFINVPSAFVSSTQTPCNPDLLFDPSLGCPNLQVGDF
jgi:hypothetical protein